MSNCSWAWLCALRTNRLEEMAKNWHAHVSRWLMLSCHWQLWVLLPMCLFDCLLVFSFVGRWLLPSLVDTGDICCHYWQHILDFFRYPSNFKVTQAEKLWFGSNLSKIIRPVAAIKSLRFALFKLILWIGILSTSWEISARWEPQNPVDVQTSEAVW